MSDDRTPPQTDEPFRRETLYVYNDRTRLGLLLVVAALGGVGVGFGLATMAYDTRLPALARVAPFDLGPKATPSLLRAPRCENRHGHRAYSYSYSTGPWLGVQLQSLSPDLRQALGAPDDLDGGAVVTWVFRGSAADAAGLHAGDVIVAVDGDAVDDSRELVRAVGARSVGDEIEITVVRDGKREVVTATLSHRATNDNLRVR